MRSSTYKKVAAKKPNSTAVLSNLIAVSLSRNDNNAVKEYSDKLVRLQPQSRSALEGLAAIALAAGKFDQAAQRVANCRSRA